ncbi:hypothetical protein SAMN05444365_10328 [Micromonospora pattaloongensis]|uniref:Phosphotransferase enzyme family protein n=1 Tax=Micromonospora pattaloongensis TaxID=405436 RepID=A0A1H3LP34_9ACTN|nr:hypothetical protein [Micromonospora pattaloongensis]SDY66086.1 hypothetical protein SAMN05444365_10328 [Micromonospora pattaloongensis]
MTRAAEPRVGDPRGRRDGLGWVTRAVFPDPRVRLTVGSGAAAEAGRRVVARYAIVPSVDRARFLLPLGTRRVTAASVLAYNALRPPTVRAARAALGAAAWLGALQLARMPVLTVSIPGAAEAAELVLAAHVSAALGQGPLVGAFGVRPPDPNHKPTLQLFDVTGRPRGYAKIGWNDATRGLVRAEAAALGRLPRPPAASGYPLVPRVSWHGDWAGQAVTVIEPLPPDVRGVDADAPPRLAELLAVARRGGPPRPTRQLAGSPFLAGLADRASGSAAAVEAGARAVDAVRRLGERHGATLVEFGDWHGDWVPWNLGARAGRLVAWDWEHSGSDAPVGFDLAHQGFQCALVLRARPLSEAVRAADDLVARHGARLGLDERQRRLVVDAYLVEMWLRTWRLADGGAGWNPTLHPGLLDEIERRLCE